MVYTYGVMVISTLYPQGPKEWLPFLSVFDRMLGEIRKSEDGNLETRF